MSIATAVSGTRRRRNFGPYLWVLPAVLIYFVFKLAPMIGGVYLALLQWDGIEPAKFVGLQNFQRILDDEIIGLALWNNVKYAVGTVIGKTVLALFLALLLHQALRGRSFYRTALFLPVVMSFVVVGILWAWLYNAQFGLINSLLRGLGLEALILDWLGDTRVALWSLMVVDIWKWYGFHMVIFLAGLQTIPAELYEAAHIDGATRWRQFLHITLPLLQPVMLVNVTLSLMGAFNVFDIPYVMTEGGPANSTMVMALHIYVRGFKFYRFGYSAAMSYVLLTLVTILAAIQMRLMSRESVD
ncbi:MAG: sugar ABC transporter permease [Chloroflexi bacterium]|nr:MAG: sugar ABC transporter permease [Chloroflexota bacterium]